ncbi:hypothetical protein [Actinomadura luteofluorescens]|uniref:hypothetical protein n=1 Tax=Actinomadura luteofluorescens TaxID=46163 RepID=UPI003D8D0F3F
MKIADIKALPEGTQLRVTSGEIVTLASVGTSRIIVRDADGQTHEYAGVSVHTVPDPYPLVTGMRRGLTGRTVTVERATRTVARDRKSTTPDWEALIGRRCVVVREDGRLRDVPEIEDGWVADAELMATLVAETRGAEYIPAGS